MGKATDWWLGLDWVPALQPRFLDRIMIHDQFLHWQTRMRIPAIRHKPRPQGDVVNGNHPVPP